MTVAVAGAGWSGAVIARRLADAGHHIDIYERRNHIGGNCHTERRDGVMVHTYGPHIFHTANERVWDWVRQWGEFRPYRLKVMSTAEGHVFSLPVNLHTINQLYGQAWTPAEAEAELAPQQCDPRSFEDAAIAAVGERIYRTLFAGYTQKQWGITPAELPADVFKRLPVRFTYDDNYFTHPHQAIPIDGYTALFERIVDHPNITVHLNTDCPDADYVFWTGQLDAWFQHRYGRLRYRTLDFHWHDRPQGVALMNWPDLSVPWTRVTEHNLLAHWEQHEHTVASTEYPRDAEPGDEPFYPLRLADDRRLLDLYIDDARQEHGVSFVGRLGTYRYLDMDVAIAEALDVADRWLDGDRRPFYVDP